MQDSGGPAPEKKVPWYLGRAAVIWGLLLVGPFALPIVWLSPEFKKNVKFVITVVALFLTYLSYRYTPVLLDVLAKRLQELQVAAK